MEDDTVADAVNQPPLVAPRPMALAYEPDQWSPIHLDGCKRYTRQQLLLLRMRPSSQTLPKCKLQIGSVARINLMPSFAKKSAMYENPLPSRRMANQHQQQHQQQHKQNQQMQHQQQHNKIHHHHHQLPAQHAGNAPQPQNQHNNTIKSNQSASGDGGPGSNKKAHQRNHGGAERNCYKNKSSTREQKDPVEILHISLSTKAEVKLNESDNAWKPRSMMAAEKTATAPENNCDELYKKVRSILNKLTFDNFDVLLDQLKKLNIDTMDTLNGVILLVFDKAIDEPKFSRAYAQLCKCLVENCFPVDAGSQKLFKVTLIKKCQGEFERNVKGGAGGTEGNAAALRPMRDEMARCDEPDRKRELASAIVELEQTLRRRTVCTVGFIGELYRMEMLTSKIINWCIQAMLEGPSEEKLECLCKLLATVGLQIESKSNDGTHDKKNYVNLTDYFKQIKQIVEQKGNRIRVSNRVRFMLQDVIDLRNNNWVPRRQ